MVKLIQEDEATDHCRGRRRQIPCPECQPLAGLTSGCPMLGKVCTAPGTALREAPVNRCENRLQIHHT